MMDFDRESGRNGGDPLPEFTRLFRNESKREILAKYSGSNHKGSGYFPNDDDGERTWLQFTEWTLRHARLSHSDTISAENSKKGIISKSQKDVLFNVDPPQEMFFDESFSFSRTCIEKEKLDKKRPDLNIMNSFENENQRKRESELGILETDKSAKLEKEEALDSLPIRYENEVSQWVDNILDQEFSDSLKTEKKSICASSVTPIPILGNDKRNPHSSSVVYKWFLGTIAVVIFIVVGFGGYFFLFPIEGKDDRLVIIRAKQEELKVKPEDIKKNEINSGEQVVYNHVEGRTLDAAEQKKLIDKTEIPIDIMAESSLSSLAIRLDQSSIMDIAMAMAARSIPIHIVPTVVLDRGRDIAAFPERYQKRALPVLGSFPGIFSMQNEHASAPNRSDFLDKHKASLFQKVVKRIQETPSHQVDLGQQIRDTAENANARMKQNNFYVQISSQPSEKAAQQLIKEEKNRFSGLVDGNDIIIVPAVVPNRGTHYRVRIPVSGRDAAVRLCEQYKRAGGNCFVGRQWM